ncbi:uncharacterized protein N7503_003265 [Penicillium pulvis]|uniref:uncharacterized protein n=1 Tax=Penicillium pulvis TaxID=1562058 RepID=UPI0025474F85|nr:uncharacterized protein N7503_003265 [Penicillium pulvis]KAJ5805663.1 hypothetical protein N7503_003265 [Penicillium pulvis]
MQSDKTLSSSSPNTASKPSHPYFSAPVSDSKGSEREQPWKKIVNKDPLNTSKGDSSSNRDMAKLGGGGGGPQKPEPIGPQTPTPHIAG